MTKKKETTEKKDVVKTMEKPIKKVIEEEYISHSDPESEAGVRFAVAEIIINTGGVVRRKSWDKGITVLKSGKQLSKVVDGELLKWSPSKDDQKAVDWEQINVKN